MSTPGEGDEGAEGGVNGEAASNGINMSGKQPNFLQKLYDFMTLDPHPCPEIIYWAADSKQLVIAQPDRFAKEVLPKLFKHDKLSSFGRQLNIYGFSRMYPGRQFKDGEGNVSDASVWSHPTLHRLSTPADISAIKRRAAPKLFRTRRLANGQVIRTRAGPTVQAKFHEIRDEMAESRRSRAVQAAGAGAGDPRATRSYAFDQHPSSGSVVAPQHRMSVDTNASYPQQQQQLAPKTYFWDRGREHGRNSTAQAHVHPGDRLECIQEGVASSWSTIFSSGSTFEPPPLHSLPVTGDLYRQGTASFSAVGSLLPPNQPSVVPTMPAVNLAVQSCPASIHTSPVLRAADPPLDIIPSPLFSTSPTSAIQVLPAVLNPLSPQAQLAPLRIAQPVAPAPDSFVLSSNSPTEGQLTPSPASALATHRDSVASALSAFSALSSSQQSDHVDESPPQPVSAGWQEGTIDPRWVSLTGSVWHTPAVTPRSGSPVMASGPPQYRPYYPSLNQGH